MRIIFALIPLLLSMMILPVFAPSHPEYAGVDTPLEQVAQDIGPEAVICKEGLVLIIKHNGSPACVRLETTVKLEKRGWGVMPPPCCKTIPHTFTKEDVLSIAQEFIKFSPTFAFDGIEKTLSLKLVAIRESFPEQYVIEAEFDSLHGGYGNRTNEISTQVITLHTINLVVINGEVTSAIIDGKWDELNQMSLPWTPKKGSDEMAPHENIEEFSLVYTKEGGIAGISESIVIHSAEKTMIKRTAQEQTEILLDESQISSLMDTINEAELLWMGTLVYPPDEGWADYFTYTLRVMSGDAESNITWTDTNNVPEDLVLISQQIEEAVSHGGEVIDYVSLIDNLRANDATVNTEGEIEQPFFSVTGFSIQVNGASIQVFEHNNSEDAESDASLVSQDGSSIGTSVPFWVGDPHFYHKEKIIVLYVGSDPVIEELLESVLGSQFAGR